MPSIAGSKAVSPWPHRLAVLLVCVVFPLIWVGGLVTTYDAGMAVPDWPNTYGYNLFAYPWQTWLFGPWDLFIEHGHRLLGALAGMVTIGLVIAVFRDDRRRWMRWVAAAALVAVIGQGLLGGARVLLDARRLAMIHGCVAPAFFAFCTAAAVFTSRWWRERGAPAFHEAAGRVRMLSALTLAFAYLQVVLGAQLRHMPADGAPGAFRAAVAAHLLMAAVVLVHAAWLAWAVVGNFHSESKLRRPALALVALVVVQISLGAATWIVNYSWPTWLGPSDLLAAYTIEAKGALQSWVVTSHVAIGSLIVATATMLTLRLWRSAAPAPRAQASWSGRKEAIA